MDPDGISADLLHNPSMQQKLYLFLHEIRQIGTTKLYMVPLVKYVTPIFLGMCHQTLSTQIGTSSNKQQQ